MRRGKRRMVVGRESERARVGMFERWNGWNTAFRCGGWFGNDTQRHRYAEMRHVTDRRSADITSLNAWTLAGHGILNMATF